MSWCTTTGVACRKGSAWRSRTAWACRSCGPWSLPSWTARWGCGKASSGAPMWCYGYPLADALGSLSNVCLMTNATVRPRRMSGPHCKRKLWSDSATGLRAGVATLESATLVFAHAAPYARVLAGIECPTKALRGNRTPITDQFRVSDLRESRAAVPNREEQLGILVTTDRLVAPIH